ncbi:MAG TPA: DUF4928 family protein [Prosthecobacter sp.]
MTDLDSPLTAFKDTHGLSNKGALCVMLVVTRHARDKGLPLDPASLRTAEKGQVLGLGVASVQAILAEHGITRVLAKEGGRTSRGSLGNMERYVEFLNSLHAAGLADVDAIEKWWVARVTDYFAGEGFTLNYDASKSLRFMVDDLMAQAIKRQKEDTGTMYAGALLQHLVGAKLSLALGKGAVPSHGFSVADSSTSRSGDFLIEDVCIHVTTAPGEALMQKCAANLRNGLRPLIVTTAQSHAGARSLAAIHSLEDRVDIIEAGQFIATNLYEWSLFKAAERKLTLEKLLTRYNEIVKACETDPALQIKFGN